MNLLRGTAFVELWIVPPATEPHTESHISSHFSRLRYQYFRDPKKNSAILDRYTQPNEQMAKYSEVKMVLKAMESQ